MSSPDLMAVVTASAVNDLLGGPLRHKTSIIQIPTAEEPVTVITAKVSREDFLGIAQDVQATIDKGQYTPNGKTSWMNLWITSPGQMDENCWYGDKGLVGLSVWGDE